MIWLSSVAIGRRGAEHVRNARPVNIAVAKPARRAGLVQGDRQIRGDRDFPTPPLPLATAMMCLIPSNVRGSDAGPPALAGGAWISIKTFASASRGHFRRIFSASSFILRGMAGSFAASASWTVTLSPVALDSLTNPKETISRLKPGYFTVLSASLTSSSVAAMSGGELTRRLRVRKGRRDSAVV